MKDQSSRIRSLSVFLASVATIVALYLSATHGFQHIVSTLEEIRSRPLCDLPKPPRCEFPLVYNKPPKTASTKIRIDITEWGKTVRRSVYRCSPFTRQATFQIRECIPYDLDGCAIVATHVKLSSGMRNILKSRIGDFRTLTSTRDPSSRIFSFFLQVAHTPAAKALKDKSLFQDFVSEFNPWELYNYHTGEGREGSCPLSLQDIATITELVHSVDIVIDADLPEISNAILNYTNLFQLSDSVVKSRTSQHYNFTMADETTKDLVKTVSCVEDEMHRMFRLRMASMYEEATGTKCLSKTRYPVPTCF